MMLPRCIFSKGLQLASGFPEPMAGCCCALSYRRNLLSRVLIIVTLFPEIGPDHRIGDGSTPLPSADSARGMKVKSP